MSETMLAGRMNFATKTFVVKEVPIPVPGPAEARVKVRAAGVCLSDVHLIQGILSPLLLAGDEVTLGHEVAGEVDLLGDGVTGPAPGTRVIVGAGKHVGDVVWTMVWITTAVGRSTSSRRSRSLSLSRTACPLSRPPSSLTLFPPPGARSSGPAR